MIDAWKGGEALADILAGWYKAALAELGKIDTLVAEIIINATTPSEEEPWISII